MNVNDILSIVLGAGFLLKVAVVIVRISELLGGGGGGHRKRSRILMPASLP